MISMADVYQVVFFIIVVSIISFGLWRDIDYFKLRKRVKKLEQWKGKTG